MIEQPVGPAVDYTPPDPACPRTPMEGRTVGLEPVDPERHVGDLYACSKDGESLWTYLNFGPFESEAAMRRWLDTVEPQTDPLAFTIVDRKTDKAEGMASFLRITPAHGVIEIGAIWFAPRLQRSVKATEAIFLMMKRSFDELGYRRLEWKCDHFNAPSRRAAERFGFTYEGLFRKHIIYKGRSRDTAWYAMLDDEWPVIRDGFEAWLDPANFDTEGRQKRALSDFLAR